MKDEYDLIIDLQQENQSLKERLAFSNAILDVLKAKGFESEIIYVKYEIENGLSKLV